MKREPMSRFIKILDVCYELNTLLDKGVCDEILYYLNNLLEKEEVLYHYSNKRLIEILNQMRNDDKFNNTNKSCLRDLLLVRFSALCVKYYKRKSFNIVKIEINLPLQIKELIDLLESKNFYLEFENTYGMYNILTIKLPKENRIENIYSYKNLTKTYTSEYLDSILDKQRTTEQQLQLTIIEELAKNLMHYCKMSYVYDISKEYNYAISRKHLFLIQHYIVSTFEKCRTLPNLNILSSSYLDFFIKIMNVLCKLKNNSCSDNKRIDTINNAIRRVLNKFSDKLDFYNNLPYTNFNPYLVITSKSYSIIQIKLNEPVIPFTYYTYMVIFYRLLIKVGYNVKIKKVPNLIGRISNIFLGITNNNMDKRVYLGCRLDIEDKMRRDLKDHL